MAEQTYRVRIVRGDAELEAEGDRAFVLDMLDRFESSLRPSARRSAGTSRAKATGDAPEAVDATTEQATEASPSEFIRRLGFKKHTDRVLAFGYYLEHYKGSNTFTAADINSLYYDAKMESSNTSQMLVNNIRRGLVMEAKGSSQQKGRRKAYTLTGSGQDFVRARLSEKSE